MTQRLLLVVLLLGGCTEMMDQPTREELDWNPPTLSKTGCPDLSGRYLAPRPGSISYRWAFPFGYEKDLYSSRDVYLRDKELDVIVTLESNATGIRVRVDNGRSQVESFAAYDGETIGCHSGMLVSRFSGRLIRPGESGDCSSLSYGENRISVNRNHDLVVESSRRARCSTWGSLKNQQPKTQVLARPSIFRHVE
jgi:hypothetical protein